METVLKKFTDYDCKNFYILSFLSDTFFGNDRLVISGCNDLLKRDIYFLLEKNREVYTVSFTLKINGVKSTETFEVDAILFNELLIQLDGIDEMRARQISAVSPIYGMKRSRLKNLL
jgi:hypothetical protein